MKMVMKTGSHLNSILLIDKPAGITSHDTLQRVKRNLGIKKMGHSGTLDLFASGLLVAATGAATKLTRLFLESDKKYRALVQLGIVTDTDDPSGEVVARHETGHLTSEDVEKAADQFRGEIQQRPPQYSALKIEGKRASDRVRNGEVIEIPLRPVTVHSLNITAFDAAAATVYMDIHCSSGTYIRSIARDLGEVLGTGAHVKELRRTASGHFSIEDAVGPDSFDAGNNEGVISPLTALSGLTSVMVSDEAVSRVKNGAFFRREDIISVDKKDKKTAIVLDDRKNIIAIATIDWDKWHITYLNVFPSPL